MIGRKGEVAHASTYGLADLEARTPVADDTLWRVYSMTKPITSVAAMMLWEEGHFELTDEISRWLPEFADMKVFDKGSITRPFMVPAIEPIRVWHLMSHTSGLTYGFLQSSTVDAIYRANGDDMDSSTVGTLEEACQLWASMPLLFQPGTRWGYSVATDVLGRLVEVISGQEPRRVLRRADLRAAWHDRRPLVGGRRRRRTARRALHAGSPYGQGGASAVDGRPRAHPPRQVLRRRRAHLYRRRLPALHADAAQRGRTGRRTVCSAAAPYGS